MTPTHGNRFQFDENDPDLTVDHPSSKGGPRDDSPAPGSDDREDRLLAAIRDYKAALEAGRRPDRRELLARHPDIADDLSACLDGLAFVQEAVVEIAGAAGSPGEPDVACSGSGTPAGGCRAGGDGDSDSDGDGNEGVAGRPLGDFRLVREIGRGGMGVVYEAVQLSLGRRVAVKVLPLASALDPRHLQRFRNEAQAAAQLHHTNIVPVYAVGCERSVHFYAMQLIEGQSLADVVRDLRRIAGRDAGGAAAPAEAPAATTDLRAVRRAFEKPPPAPGTRAAPGSGGGTSIQLTPPSAPADGPPGSHPADSLSSLRSARGAPYYRAVARLWLQAAEALDYAHRAGVVHRDIKPANLLLDGHGTLWITDFGLAQFYAEAGANGLTETGDLVGTLRYMSPEQASGRAVVLDQRTDVYSLGVTFYEMLTLERALPGETREQLLYQLGAHDPRPARSVDRAVPQELETIVGKATAKDPADRYPSARALADDLRRFLQDEPILARPPTALDRAVKWTRRHRTLALAAVVVLLLAAVGLAASTALIAREQARTNAAYLRERGEAAEAWRQKASAAASFEQARDVVNFLSRVAADELADSPGSAEVRKEMLEAALDYYQGFLDARRQDPSARAELTEAQAYVQNILAELAAFADYDRVDTAARLLSESSVQQALGLSADQADKAWLIGDDSDGPGGSGGGGGRGRGRDGGGFGGPRGPGASPGPRTLRGLTSDEKRARYAAAAARTEAAVGGLLTPKQAERLRQITRQVRAPASFGDRDVAEALALTREQKDTVRRAQADFRIAARKSYGPPRRPSRPGDPPDDRPSSLRSLQESFDDVMPSRQTLQDEAVRRVLAQLTPTQAAAWRRLVGEPFAAAASLNRGPFPPGGGPGGPGGPDGGGRRGGPSSPDEHGPGELGDHGPGGFGRDGPGRGGPGDRGGDRGPPGAFRDEPARDGPNR